jgi:hypothetical protein
MSNKSKRKNTRQVAKQKRRRTPSNLSLAVPSQPLPPDFKISAAILHLAEPLRTLYREPHRLQAIIAITVMAWNIALFPEDEQPHVQGMLLESLPPQMGGEDVGVLLSTIDTGIGKSNGLFHRPLLPPSATRPHRRTQAGRVGGRAPAPGGAGDSSRSCRTTSLPRSSGARAIRTTILRAPGTPSRCSPRPTSRNPSWHAC